MLLKNTAGQKWRVFAFNRTTGVPKTGDAANITANISLNHGVAVALTDLHPVETEDGFYLFDLEASETNGVIADIYPESTTPDIQLVGVPATHDIEIPADPSLPLSTFQELAQAPKRTRTAEGTVEERTVDELIKADRYSNPAPDAVPWGIRVARMKPPSTCS